MPRPSPSRGATGQTSGGTSVAGTKSWIWAAVPLLLMAALLVVAPQYGIRWRADSFLAMVALLAAELGVIGWLINDRPIGAFIDNRNRISLSKLQAGAWTVIVLAGFATAAAFNTMAPDNGTGYVTALAVQIPGELLLAMGISATSLVASPALLSLKAAETPSDTANSQAATKMNVAQVSSNGKVATNDATTGASWADLVTGEEVGNVGYPDLGKIQQALITLLLLGCYMAYTYSALARMTTVTVTSLPLLDPSFVWLMGISHATYLAYKAAPHTQSAQT